MNFLSRLRRSAGREQTAEQQATERRRSIAWRSTFALLAVTAILPFAGCATAPKDPVARAEFKAHNDPLEPTNRKIFAMNEFLDRKLIKPAAKGYRHLLPAPIRAAIRRMLDNLGEPIVMGNCLLQFRLKDAGVTGARFVVNSTAGFVGINDVASEMKLKKQVGDFGQTLWTWKVPEGPYIVIPILGPTNPRDGIGSAVDGYCDPWRYALRNKRYGNTVTITRTILDGLDQREQNLDIIDELQKESIDYYASLRSLYRQNRAAELTGGKTAAPLQPENFYDDPGK
ncbi:MAG TPA: VacJ family lipoprotein [Opitutaceae bacterium]|nr:VacJ family lipoprotein [Opitutaceae bacterium]